MSIIFVVVKLQVLDLERSQKVVNPAGTRYHNVMIVDYIYIYPKSWVSEYGDAKSF